MAIQFIKDPVSIVQSAGSSYIGNELDQTYIVSPTLVEAGETITLIDTDGVNKVQFSDGVEIVESIVVADEAQLTLSNGAVINIRGADGLL